MDRKRTVLAAAAVSIVLTAGSTAFALANGVFVTQPVDRVGSFQAIEARLVPATKAVRPSATTGAAPPETDAPVPRTGSGATTTEPYAEPSGASPAGPTTEPTTEPSDDSAHEAPVESHEPSSSSTSTPTSAPQVNAPATTTTVAHSAPSTVPEHGDDDSTATGGSRDD
jgi:hypothetical protein